MSITGCIYEWNSDNNNCLLRLIIATHLVKNTLRLRNSNVHYPFLKWPTIGLYPESIQSSLHFTRYLHPFYY